MNRCAASSRRWRRWRRLLIAAPLVVVCLFLLLQIAFLTPWAKNLAATQVASRTGFECRIEGLSWTPWGGASVRGLVLEQPEGIGLEVPLLRIERLTVHPRYTRIHRWKQTLESIDLDGVEVHVTGEMLASMLMSVPPPEPQVGLVAANPAAIPSPQLAENRSAVAAESSPGDESQESSDTTEEISEMAVPSQRQPLAIEVRSVSLTLWSSSRELQIASVRDISFQGVLGGGDERHEGRIGEVQLGSDLIETEVVFELVSIPNGHRVSIKEFSGESTLKAGYVELGSHAVRPFRIGLDLERKGSLSWSGTRSDHLAIERLKLRGGLEGYLRFPQSWQGQAAVAAENLELQAEGATARFDRAEAGLWVQGGSWWVPDARLVGPELSVLGNGRLAGSDSRAVVRFVMSDPIAGWFQNSTGMPADLIQSLSPGNRRFVDLEVASSSRGWIVAVPGTGWSAPLKQMMESSVLID